MPFQIPHTINDENEWSLPILPFYVTGKEFALIAAGAGLGYLVGYPIFDGNLINLAIAVIIGLIGAAMVKAQKKKHPPGWPWLWDFLLAHGLRGKRGLMKPSKKIVWFSMHHNPAPAGFLTGATKPGIDLTVSAPWQLITPPATIPASMVPPRRRRTYVDKPSPAPPWFAHAQGFSGVVSPTIPVTIRWVAIQDELPARDPAR